MIITGTITKTLPDGTTTDCEYLVDTEKAELVQLGGESDIKAEDIDLILALMNVTHEGDTPDA